MSTLWTLGRGQVLRATALFVGLFALAACANGGPSASSTPTPSGTNSTSSPGAPAGPVTPRVTAPIPPALEVPWGIDSLPEGAAVVPERDSPRVLRIDPG